MDFSVAGKVVLVTGAGRGLGRGIALGFAAGGARAAVNDIDRASAEAVAGEIAAAGGESLALGGDVAVKRDAAGLIQATIERFGRLDVLVNNAGIITAGSVADYDEDEWDRTIDVNLKGTFLCCQAAVPHLIAQRSGRIINTGSINGKIPRLHNSAYCAAKAAVAHFTRVLALELAPYGITANTLSGGTAGGAMASAHFPDPETQKKLLHGDLSLFRLGVPLGKFCRPEDVAAMAIYLASDAANHVTGQELFVDGGQSIF